MTTKTVNKITNFPNALGWYGRFHDFRRMEAIFGNQTSPYTIFKFIETKKFATEFKHLNSKEAFLYVCLGDVEQLMTELQLGNFDKNELYEEDGVLKLTLTRTTFKDSIIRYPKSRVLDGEFYQLTAEEFSTIPFRRNPIAEKRNSIFGENLADSIKLSDAVKTHFDMHFTPIHTAREKSYLMKYRPILVEGVKHYVPKDVNDKAILTAIQHNLTNLEFNFLNYFYETGKALRNDVGQLFFDEKSKGIGWGHSRDWVKKKMGRLMELGLVKFESRHDCRDPRYTSWYFYDAEKNLNELNHDF